MRRHSWHAQTSARAAATLAALCGLAAAQNLPPMPAPAPPGMCKDTMDMFWDKRYNEVTKCCVDGARDKTMVWARGCADGAHVETKCTSGCGASSKYGFDMCCATECCAAPTPRGHGQCPEFSPGQFPRVGGIQSCEDVVQFHFVWQADTMDAEVQLWIEGLSLTADYINGKGGLRIGEGKVGYVNMTSTEYHPDPKAAGRDPFIKLYRVPGYCHSDSTALNLDCCGAGQSTIYAPVAPVARDARVAAEPR